MKVLITGVSGRLGGYIVRELADKHEPFNRKLNAFQQTSLILQALLEPALSQRIKDGDFVKIFDRFNLLHTVIN